MTPQVVEEYVLETAERGQARVYHTRLTILQRHANDEYIGELYVERDYKVGANRLIIMDLYISKVYLQPTA